MTNKNINNLNAFKPEFWNNENDLYLNEKGNKDEDLEYIDNIIKKINKEDEKEEENKKKKTHEQIKENNYIIINEQIENFLREHQQYTEWDNSFKEFWKKIYITIKENSDLNKTSFIESLTYKAYEDFKKSIILYDKNIKIENLTNNYEIISTFLKNDRFLMYKKEEIQKKILKGEITEVADILNFLKTDLFFSIYEYFYKLLNCLKINGTTLKYLLKDIVYHFIYREVLIYRFVKFYLIEKLNITARVSYDKLGDFRIQTEEKNIYIWEFKNTTPTITSYNNIIYYETIQIDENMQMRFISNSKINEYIKKKLKK